LPRRYHRPPTAKRRKAKRIGSQEPVEGRPIDGAEAGASPSEDGYDEAWDEEYEEAPVVVVETQRDRSQHLQRDFSYVRSELIRVGVIGTFLVVSLVITSVLR